MKLTFNAPITLLFTAICVMLLVISPMIPQAMANMPIFGIFMHANWQHLINNMMFVLLLGPIIEEKYGSLLTGGMIIFTAFVTWFLNAMLFPGEVIIGASGIVFMYIMLASVTNIKGGQIPITVILVALLYLGQECINALKPDNISQFGHIVGGICGTILGFTANYFKK